MEGQDYLNQISAKAQPVKKEKKGIIHSKFFVVGMIGLIALLLIIILGAVLGSGKGGEKDLSLKLELHLSRTAEVIKTYQSSIKSSELRSDSASLQSVLLDADKSLVDYLTEKYEYKAGKTDKKLTEQADTERDALSNELFEAKITGYLDGVFAQKMAYEISMFMNEETILYRKTNNENLKAILDKSYDSLENLYGKFNDFSEAK